MLILGGKVQHYNLVNHSDEKFLLLILSSNRSLPEVIKDQYAFIIDAESEEIPSGFRHYLFIGVTPSSQLIKSALEDKSYSILPNDYQYLSEGDIVRLIPEESSIRVLFRKKSNHNSILVTEQCNHYCLMCSQPPKKRDDSWILDEIEQLIPLIPKNTHELGFTGGEPTTNPERFLSIMNLVKNYLPHTAVHILSNGRTFSDQSFSQEFSRINLHDAMVGIPLYADTPEVHDYIVQADGAFDETIRGIINLKKYRQNVELRIVLHKVSIDRLIPLCEFIARNLLFVNQVALMGLEMMGFTRANLDKLWIDPFEYKDTLSKAVHILNTYGIKVLIYNHQLCLINDDVREFYVKSISDWKNEYAEECKDCLALSECGGFFSSGIKYGYSQYLKPFREA